MTLFRNLMTALIPWFFSIHMVIKEPETSKLKEGQLKIKDNLEYFAYKDFDMAMKSKIALKYFRKYIYTQSDHYLEALNDKLSDGKNVSNRL